MYMKKHSIEVRVAKIGGQMIKGRIFICKLALDKQMVMSIHLSIFKQ